jgi:hypothetical protein
VSLACRKAKDLGYPTNCGRPGFSPATLASMDRRRDMHASPIWHLFL